MTAMLPSFARSNALLPGIRQEPVSAREAGLQTDGVGRRPDVFCASDGDESQDLQH